MEICLFYATHMSYVVCARAHSLGVGGKIAKKKKNTHHLVDGNQYDGDTEVLWRHRYVVEVPEPIDNGS